MKAPILVTLTGPSGTGKSFLAQQLKKEGFEELVSVTTRAPRSGEINGVHYTFIDKAAFFKMKEENAFIETISLGDPGKESFYGVPASEVKRVVGLGKSAVVVAEPDGVKQIFDYCQNNGWKVIRVFINNPLDELIGRILDRFALDIEGLNLDNAKDFEMYSKKKLAHGSRIERISRFEQDKWVIPAFSGQDKYELLFDNYGPLFEKEVGQKIHEKVSEYQNTDNSNLDPNLEHANLEQPVKKSENHKKISF